MGNRLVDNSRKHRPYLCGKRLSLTISPQAVDLLDQLLETGPWGRNRARVARECIYRVLREVIPPPRLEIPGVKK